MYSVNVPIPDTSYRPGGLMESRLALLMKSSDWKSENMMSLD